MKFIKKPVEVEAWQLVEDDVDKTQEYQIHFMGSDRLGISLKRVPHMVDRSQDDIYLWCLKSSAWVDCPYGTFIVKEQDGTGFYPYHDAAAFLQGHDRVPT